MRDAADATTGSGSGQILPDGDDALGRGTDDARGCRGTDGGEVTCDGAAVAWSDGYLGYRFGDEHPMHPLRLALTMSLAGATGVLDRPGVRIVEPAPAGDDLLGLVHDPAYVEAVRQAPGQPFWSGCGLGTPDNPVFPDMHHASALIAGGSVLAAERVWTGEVGHAVNIAGGLHHAMRDRAAGFCVYNDPAIAIRWLLEHGAERVAYVDVDVHHGDGVQSAFYDDPRVLTISLHQSPRSLWFPGTGAPTELGGPGAPGDAVNVALPAGTDDAGWLRAFHAVVPSLLRAFRPEVLVTQCGCDTHREDPLAGLDLTVDGQRASYLALHDLAHELCDGRWLALGGGGYGLVRCVPRAWTHLLAIVTGAPLDPATPVPPQWSAEVARRGVRVTPPTSMTDAINSTDTNEATGATDPAAAGHAVRWTPWEPADQWDTTPVDSAITATRRAAFPLHGLDPDDPRD